MINASDIRGKLALPTGRAQRLAKDTRPLEARIKELYLAAFSREPRADELKTALNYLAEQRTNAAGQKIDAQQAARENFQDLLWAIMTTKEFLFNH
jgi:hypothetical protein